MSSNKQTKKQHINNDPHHSIQYNSESSTVGNSKLQFILKNPED